MTEIPDWHITGDGFDNCRRAVACPCTFAQAPDNGFADERQAEALPRIFGGQVGGFPARVAELFAEGRQVRGVELARITFEVAPDHSHWGTEIAGKVKACARALTGPTSLPGKYPQLINPPGSETGPGQIVTWGKSTVCSVDAFGYHFQWTTNSSKHIPFDWIGP